MVNYWWQTGPFEDQYMVTIKANSDTILIAEGFNTEEDAEYYAEIYVRGYKDGRGEL